MAFSRHIFALLAWAFFGIFGINAQEDAPLDSLIYPLRDISPVLYDHDGLRPHVDTLRYLLGDCTTIQDAFYAGNCAILDGHYARAVTHYDALANPAAHVNHAWANLQMGTTDFTALHGLEARFTDAAARADFLARRAQLHALAYDYEAAIMDMDATVRLQPDNPAWYTLRGQMILLIYEWDRALADFNMALAQDPDYADAYFYRGTLWYTRAEREKAQDDFARYLELAPKGRHAANAQLAIESIKAELEALAG